MDIKNEVARSLLSIEAVILRPHEIGRAHV